MGNNSRDVAIGVLVLAVWVGACLAYQRLIKKNDWERTVEISIFCGLMGLLFLSMASAFVAGVIAFVNPPSSAPPLIAWPPYGAREGMTILTVLWLLGAFTLAISDMIASVRAKGEQSGDLPSQRAGNIVNGLPAFVSGGWEVGVFQGGVALSVIFLLLRSAAPHLTLEDAMLNTIGWALLIGLIMAASKAFVWLAQRAKELIWKGETSGMSERLKKRLTERHRDSILSRITADLTLAYSINPEPAGFVSADGLLLLPESLRDGLGLKEGGEELRFFRSAESERYEIWPAGDIEQLLIDDPATGDAVLRGLSPVIAQGKRNLILRVEENLEILRTLHAEPEGYISRDGLLLVPKSVREGLSISDEYGGGISLIHNKETGRYEVWTTEELDRWFSSEPIAEDKVAQLSDAPTTDDDEIPF